MGFVRATRRHPAKPSPLRSLNADRFLFLRFVSGFFSGGRYGSKASEDTGMAVNVFGRRRFLPRP